MHWLLTILLMVITLLQLEMLSSRSVSVVMETSAVMCMHVTELPGVVTITSDDVEQHLQQNDAIIIDVRNVDEAAEFGQIPSANVLPGRTMKLACSVVSPSVI